MPDLGDKLPEQTFTITRADLVRYAGASGDFNPIHWSDRIAREVGLPNVLAHGMLTMALAGRVVTDWAGPGSVKEFRTRFVRPVEVPDTDEGTALLVSGEITGLNEDGTVQVDLSVTVDGQKVLAATRATVTPPTGLSELPLR